MTTLNRIAIFKVGTHTSTDGEQLTADASFLQSIATAYDPALHEAPAVIGHPKDNLPAYGWVKSLEFDEGEGVLYANFADVEPQFAQLLADKRFKKRSSSFYPPTHPSNPVQGTPYLRHVAFLGAGAPAIKGLKDFGDADTGYHVYEFSEFDQSTLTVANKDTPMSNDAMQTPSTQPNTTQPTAESATQTAHHVPAQPDLTAKQAELDAREAAIAEREAALLKQQQTQKAQNFSEFADGLIKNGQITPAEKSAVVAVMLDLDSTPKTFDFSENGTVKKKSSVNVLQEVMSRLSPVIDFSEHSGDDPNATTKPAHSMDTEVSDADLDKQIQNYAEAHGITYAEAAVSFDR